MSEWRYLTDDGAGAADGLATDEALLHHYSRGAEAPAEAALRLYTYRPHCALVGRWQTLEAEVDVDACRRRGVEVGRRPTGGGAILMGPGQLGVAVATRAPADAAPRELLRRYADGVIAGLRRLGIEASFRSRNDLEVEGRKIAGLGLYVDDQGGLLFHSSVLADLDVALMLEVLRIPGAKLSDKAVARVAERVTTVSRELGRELAAADIREAVREGFVEALDLELLPARLDAAERDRRNVLAGERYGDTGWIDQRRPTADARGTALLKTPEGLVRVYAGVAGTSVKSAMIAGDFNVLPPELARFERSLRWCRADADRIRALAARELDGGVLGVPAEALADAVWEAVQRALERARDSYPDRPEGSCYFPEAGAGAAEAPTPAAATGGEG